MRSLIRSAAVLAGLVVAIGLAQPAAAQSYALKDEQKVHDMVNGTRAKKGLRSLSRNSQLVLMARGQADRMEARGSIFHNPDLSGEITRRGLKWKRVGENVGMGPTVELVQQAFLDSPPHYENIVRPDYTHMGIGVVSSDDGNVYVVQVFATLTTSTAVAPPPVKPAPARVAPAAAPAAIRPAAQAPRVAPVSATPQPAPKPAAKASTDPNALTGGYVAPVELFSPEQVRYLAASAESGFDKVVDVLTFWS